MESRANNQIQNQAYEQVRNQANRRTFQRPSGYRRPSGASMNNQRRPLGYQQWQLQAVKFGLRLVIDGRGPALLLYETQSTFPNQQPFITLQSLLPNAQGHEYWHPPPKPCL